MLGVILNETEILDKFKKDYEIPSHIKITDVITMLIRDYYLIEIEKKDSDEKEIRTIIYKNIMSDLEKAYKDEFVYTRWDKTVQSMVNRFYTNKNKYQSTLEKNDIKEIFITENELSTIKNLNDLILEKIAFILLVYAKIYNIQLKGENDYWVNQNCNTICKEARVGAKGNEQKLKLNQLYKKEYISMSNLNNRTSIKVNYVDKEQIKTENCLVITNFEGVIYQYLIWRGEKWKQCEVCGKWIKISGNRMKYCNTCCKIVECNLTKKRVNKYRKNRNVTE